MKELKQSKNFVKREFRFTGSKLFYNVSKFGNGNEIDILFENLNGEKGAGNGTVFLALYWFSRQDFWKIKITNDCYIYIHKNIPNESATEKFLSELMKSKNEFLKENYAIIDENLSYESQLNNFKWLKSIDAISKEKFDQKYAELKQTVKPQK